MVSSSKGVSIANVSKRFGDVVAVDDVSLDVDAGSFVSLLGPSGCGKTTLLRLLGGFEKPDGGTISIDGQDVTSKTPQSRPTAMVFQSYALFPTMTVGENVGYGLTVKGFARSLVRERVEAALKRVDLAGLADRPVGALSGGQQQRVALARAIAVEPAVILFDEPLSNLDLALREATRAELKSLQRELGTTSLYVTHDQGEALALSDKIAVMKSGRIIEIGVPESLYSRPESAFVAGFLGGANVIRDRSLAEKLSGEPMPDGKVLAIRPESLTPATEGIPVKMVSRHFLGTHSEWIVDVEGQHLRVWTTPDQPADERLFIKPSAHRWVRLDHDG
ncbi:MAG: ABC transporter ATP-binding protein [Rubricoccaceae bacterium]|nr:ABC transporter ATP-binding protein [Rubricoccaceae bacterium]